jgi:hypothetical protein
MKRFILTMAVLAPAFAASAQTSDVIWKGDFEAGASSLTGNCGAGQNQWCNDQIARPEQMQVVSDPVVQGKYAARFEVKYGDVYSSYSDQRALMTGPGTLWEDEGSDRWYRWQAMWPTGYVGSYPKWDQLADPSATSWGGTVVEWHHDANGATETGSAPLYFGADNNNIFLCLVDQATSTCREYINLMPLVRGQWHDIVMHAKWSSSASTGFIDMWIDGQHVLPMHYASNKYPGMRNYLVVGLYRNGHIGDPNLRYPNGTHVYGTDGAPGVVYLDGFIIGKTQASVMGEALLTDAPPDPGSDAGTPPPPDPTDPVADAGTVTTTTPNQGSGSTGTSVATSGTTATAASAAGGGGCSSGGGMVAWSALLGLVILGFRSRSRLAQQRG